MELLVHVSTSGNLLVGCSQVMVTAAMHVTNAHVIMGTQPFHLLLWAMTIFCESIATPSNWRPNRFSPNATLWDGRGGSCCQFNNPPWFTKKLTTDTNSIELLLCMVDSGVSHKVALELYTRLSGAIMRVNFGT